MDESRKVFISYDELRHAIGNSKDYPCGTAITNGMTEHEITQDKTLEAVIIAIESCEKHFAFKEKVIGVDSFIQTLRKVAKMNRLNYKKANISFTRLEELLKTIGLDSWLFKF